MKPFFTLLLFLAGLFALLTGVRETLAQAERLVSGVQPEHPEVAEGVDAALRGENKTAEKLFADAMKKHPEGRPGGIDAAMAFTDPSFENRGFGKLRFWLEKTAEDFPDDPEAFLLLADIALTENRCLESTMLAKHSLELLARYAVNPERRHSLQLYGEKTLALNAENQKRWQAAAAQWKRLNELDPTNAENLYRCGLVHFRLGEKEQAIKMLNEARQKDPALLPAEVLLAQLSENEGKTEEAVKLLDEAVQKNGNLTAVLSAAADLELHWNHLDKAKTYAEKARKLDPKSADAAALLGTLALYAGDYAKAEEEFTNALAASPNDWRAMNGLPLALCEQDEERQRRRALTIAKMNAQNHPLGVELQATLAWVLFRVSFGRADEAEKILMRLFDAGELPPSGAYCLAEIFAKQDRKEEAVLFLQNALGRKGNFPKRTAAETLLKTLQTPAKDK